MPHEFEKQVKGEKILKDNANPKLEEPLKSIRSLDAEAMVAEAVKRRATDP